MAKECSVGRAPRDPLPIAGGAGPFSPDPTDQLIRELIQTGRPASNEEVEQSLQRMAAVPFDWETVKVPLKHRGIAYQGYALSARESSLDYYLVKRVVTESPWANATTATQDLEDIRTAARDAAHLAVYERRGGHSAATITLTGRVLPPERLGVKSFPNLFVVYSADRGTIVSGYQFRTLDDIAIPAEARWLK